MKLSTLPRSLILTLFLLFISSVVIQAQTTAFNYQGKLTDSSAAANGNYDMQFRLFNSLAVGTGTQQGSTIANSTVQVTNGIFSVNLDFGAVVFNGGALYLEISLRPAGSTSGYTTLAPRQPITSAPYAVKSLKSATADTATSATNSTQLGGVAANQYVQTTDYRLTDSRSPSPGSGNYIQNSSTQQAGTNFNISGNGTAGGTLSANVVNSDTQYNISGSAVLSIPGYTNLFAGYSAGIANTTGAENSFVGYSTGIINKTGSNNSFFGGNAGSFNTSGFANSFFGNNAGRFNWTGNRNTFLGADSGGNYLVTTGSNNTAIGALSYMSTNNLNYATAIGSEARVETSNTIVLGRSTGADTVRVPGNLFVGFSPSASNPNVNYLNSLFVNNDGGDAANSFRLDGSANNLYIIGHSSAGASSGAGIVFRTSPTGVGELDRLAIYPDGTVGFSVLGTAGGTQLCRNASNIISACSSSLRYKTNIASFSFGMSLINQLKPISYNWKEGGASDVGFGAEEVARINPLFVTYNSKGEVEGVKYDRLSVAFVNAFREQQQQIEEQKAISQNLQTKLEQQQLQNEEQKIQIQQQLKRDSFQQQQINALIKLVCSQNTKAEVCK